MKLHNKITANKDSTKHLITPCTQERWQPTSQLVNMVNG